MDTGAPMDTAESAKVSLHSVASNEIVMLCICKEEELFLSSLVYFYAQTMT